MSVNANTDLAPYLFHQGTNFRTYEYLGVHSHGDGTVLRVWAPNAERAYVVGDFNDWSDSCEMTKITSGGIWQAVLPFKTNNDARVRYKYKFVTGGKTVYKADPYAVHTGGIGETASYLYELADIPRADGDWLAYRKKTYGENKINKPMNIYELHAGSFMRHGDGSYLSYRELADELAPYVKQMGYTHVELMPIAEHPFDGSWGYQLTGYYAPTSRFGTPEDLKYFIDKLHSYSIGVIMDWVPAHFPKDAHGLYEFDGGFCYEYQGYDRMEHAVWGTRFFDVGRTEVQSFLVSNALYWIREYHFDGLRCDAVAAMLYLDYDREPGRWTPAFDGSNKNYESIAFFRKLNDAVHAEFPDVMMIAEESTSWPMLTSPTSDGGLGFDYKWNMGWMNDMMKYISTDPLYRSYEHNALTFPLMYCFSENYVLSVSHDEVVHGKRSMLDKNFGSYEMKFAGARLFAAYTITHPGKKLIFMGSEFGQFSEWDEKKSLEWFMLDYPMHASLRELHADLNRMYLGKRCMWECDSSWDGFSWIRADGGNDNVVIYYRKDSSGGFVISALNFSNITYRDFRFGVPISGVYREILSTDNCKYGGENRLNPDTVSDKIPSDNLSDSISVTLPALSGCLFEIVPNATVGKNSKN